MTDVVQTALIASIAPTVAALAALVIGLRNAGKADETGKKADTIIEKAAEIHTLTNSNLAKVTSALAVANEKIAGLEQLVKSIAAPKPKPTPHAPKKDAK